MVILERLSLQYHCKQYSTLEHYEHSLSCGGCVEIDDALDLYNTSLIAQSIR